MEIIKKDNYYIVVQKNGTNSNGYALYNFNIFDLNFNNINDKINHRKDKYNNIKIVSFNIKDSITYLISLIK